MLDRRKGRRSGENHPGVTLTDLEVDKIRKMREEDKKTYAKICEIMDCPKSTVASICQYRRR